MSNFNKVLIMGRLTRDPELRYTPQGTAVSEIGIAINREFNAGNERRKETTFVDVTFWARQAEVVCQYVKKGAPLFVEGRLSLHTWEAQDGQRRSKLRVVAENFQFIGGGRSESEPGAGGGRADSRGGGGWSPPPGPPGPPAAAAEPPRAEPPRAAPSAGGHPAEQGFPPPAEESGPGGLGAEGLGVDESDIPF